MKQNFPFVMSIYFPLLPPSVIGQCIGITHCTLLNDECAISIATCFLIDNGIDWTCDLHEAKCIG